jgi:hypothetical protein
MGLPTDDLMMVVDRVAEAVGVIWIKSDEVAKAIERMETEDIHRRAHCGAMCDDMRKARETIEVATEEHRRDRGALHEMARQMELLRSMPAETPPMQADPKTAVERVTMLLTGPDGKRTPWSVILIAVVWQLLEAMLRHGITLGDFIRSSPSS